MLYGRYQRNSECCEKLAQSLHHLTTVEERGLFDFGSRGQEAAPLVLILDRKDDPVTPLLLQWTYQAMVHELIGLDTNRLDLSHIPGVNASLACCFLTTCFCFHPAQWRLFMLKGDLTHI